MNLAKIFGRHNEYHDHLAMKSPGYEAAGAKSALEARFTGRCIVAGAVHAPAGDIGKSFPRILATLICDKQRPHD
jgi:hypothetical protein